MHSVASNSTNPENRSPWDEVALGEPTATFVGQSPPASSALPTIGATIGRYQIIAELGSGGFGTVFKGWDPIVGRFVAMKIPRRGLLETESEVNRFLSESRRAGQLKHPGIVTVYDVVRDGPTCCIVSEFIDGPTLEEALRQGLLDEPQAVRFAAELADILDVAHRHHLVHRDVKPSNVLLDSSGRLHLTDFGVAASLDELRKSPAVMSGTPAYMPPEVAPSFQAEPMPSRPGPDHRVDIYALGVLLYRMLTGRMPFDATDTQRLFCQIQEGVPLPPRLHRPDLSADVEEICLKAMARHPGDRYRTAGDMAAALRDISERTSLAFPATGETAQRLSSRAASGRTRHGGSRSNRSVWIAVAAVGFAVGGLVIWLATRDKPAEKIQTQNPQPTPGVGDPNAAKIELAIKQLQREFQLHRRDSLQQGRVMPADAGARKVPLEGVGLALAERIDKRRGQIAEARAAKNEDEEYSLLLNQSNDLIDAGDLNQSLKAAERMIELAKGKESRAAIAYSQLGRVQSTLGDTKGALASYETAMLDFKRYYERLRDEPKSPRELLSGAARLYGLILMRMGNVYKARREYDDAEISYRQAEEIFVRHDRKSELNTLLSNMGSMYSLRGAHQKAQASLERALKMARDSKDPGEEIVAQINLANALWRNNQNARALDSYRAAYRLIDDNTNYDVHAGLLTNWLSSAIEDGQFTEAQLVANHLRRLARPNDAGAQNALVDFERMSKELRSGKKQP